MKKHIIIAGVPRAGKSTISQMISKTFGYQHVSMDSIITADVTPEERYQILKENDTPNDYTFYNSNEENYKSCFEIVDISKLIKKQCVLYGLPFFETSRNRENVINSFLQSL